MEELSRIFMLGDIDHVSSNLLIHFILEINEEDILLKLAAPKYKPEPIKIVINSFGGSMYDGLGIIGAIKASKTPVHTYCYGSAMSMGLYILNVGDKRFVSKFSTLMIHEGSADIHNKFSQLKIELDEAQRLEKLCSSTLIKHSNLTSSELKSKKLKGDWYFTASTAKSKGIIDKIL